MAFLKSSNYGGRMTSSRHWHRAADFRQQYCSFASSQFAEEKCKLNLDTDREDIGRRLDRNSRDFAVQLTKQTSFQPVLSKLKTNDYMCRAGASDNFSNLDTKCHAPKPYSCPSSGLGYWFKPSFQERKQSNIEPTRYELPKEPDIQIKELNKKLKEREHTCNDLNNTISRLIDTLNVQDIILDDRDSTIETLKYEVKKGKSTIRDLENKNEELKIKIEIKDAKLLELTNTSKIRFNTYAESVNKRKEQNSLDEPNSKLGEYKSSIEHLERRNKETENQLFNEKKKYTDCLTEQQKLKKDFEGKLSSLQSAKYDLEKNAILHDIKIKALEDELKENRAISSVMKYSRFENIEGNNSEVKFKYKQSSEDKGQARNENDHTKIVTAMRSECQEKSQKISALETQLKEALHKLSGKEEEIRVLENSHRNFKADYNRLEAKFKFQQKSITSDEVTQNKLAEANKSLHKMIEDKEKQVRQQMEQHQEALKQMQERENELANRIDMQKKEILRLENELHRSKNALSHLEKSMQSKTLEKNTNEVKADTDQRKKIAELTKQLQEARTKLHDTETELAETKSRLSKVMGNRLTDNNPNITDLSDRNRPTKLAEKYAELYDNQWTDAFDVLEKSYHKEEYVIETLLHILQDVFTFCLKKANAQMKNLGQELKFADREDKGDVTVDVRKLLKECRKAVGFTENLPKMYQSYLEQSTNDRTKTALKVRAFTTECLEMCWFMVIQDPPVAFAPLLSKGSSFDTDFYKPYTISGAKVDFVVWPPLLLHEGGPILAKGVAQGCGKKTAS